MTTDRIIVVTVSDPNDVSSWSGTPYYIYRALAVNAGSTEIVFVRGALRWFSFAARAVNRVLKQFGIVADCRFSTAYAMLMGAYLTARLRFAGQGTLLFVAGSMELAYLRTNRRIIYISDATFRAIAALNPYFRAFPRWLQQQGDQIEARSLTRADFIMYPSRWASDSAKRDYRVPSERVFALPFGPNIPEPLILYSPKTVDPQNEINILFIGSDWVIKNGDLALEVCQLLWTIGLKVRLIIAGEIPEHAGRFEFVRDLGFLRKSDASDLAVLCESYAQADFLLLPTIADAFGVVFIEAQAFGVPQIAYDVGGVGSAVIHDETGILLPAGATAEQFANEIHRCINDAKLYAKLSCGSRERYLRQANWSTWARLVLELARQ